jgi:CheY-specific phosphatase CheX
MDLLMIRIGVSVSVDAKLVRCLLREFFEGFLGLPLNEVEDSNCRGELTTLVQFTGCWTGLLALRLDWPAARLCAATMLSVDVEDLKEEDVMDATAELSNIIGGMIQLRLPPGTILSLPVVIEGTGYRTMLLHTECVVDVPVLCGDTHIRVTVHAHKNNLNLWRRSARCAS